MLCYAFLKHGAARLRKFLALGLSLSLVASTPGAPFLTAQAAEIFSPGFRGPEAWKAGAGALSPLLNSLGLVSPQQIESFKRVMSLTTLDNQAFLAPGLTVAEQVQKVHQAAEEYAKVLWARTMTPAGVSAEAAHEALLKMREELSDQDLSTLALLAPESGKIIANILDTRRGLLVDSIEKAKAVWGEKQDPLVSPELSSGRPDLPASWQLQKAQAPAFTKPGDVVTAGIQVSHPQKNSQARSVLGFDRLSIPIQSSPFIAHTPTAVAADVPAAPSAYGKELSIATQMESMRDARLNALFDDAGEEGVRRIRLVRTDADSAEGLRNARAYLAALARTPRLGSARESAAVERLRPLFRLRTRNEALLDPKDPHSLLIRAAGRLPKFGAYRYVDLTNGSRFSTTDARGAVHHFVAVRALREGYFIRVDLRTGAPTTEKYVSDELLFEVRYDRRGNVVSRKFAGPLMISTSDGIPAEHGRFVFEDGRVYSPAPGKLVVSGTVIADFLNQPETLSYRNGFAPLDVDPVTGVPHARLDPGTGDPAWHYISSVGADFKDGMVLSTGRGAQVVALFRINAPALFADRYGKEPLPGSAIGDRIPGGYSLIRLSFPSYDAFLKYDSEHLMEDVLHPEALAGLKRPHPDRSGILLAADDLREPYADDPRVIKSGFGPGAKPARVSMRRNGDVYLKEELGARAVKLGRVPPGERSGYPLRPGDKKWLFLGHQLRYYRDGRQNRDYNAFAWLTDETMSRVEMVRGALMSADSPFESGENSLIVDLARHNYPMGAEVMENGEYHFSYGASDKHTGAAKLDVMALLREMSDGSPETREGLAYRPPTRP